jgi:threonylcarbamoyladenosine tRNA methylthiotransferase MtaB
VRVALTTLGCRLNRYETALLEQGFRARGDEIVPFPGPADLVVVNSCTVTVRADADSRQAVHRARRANPDAVVVVTGCWAQAAPAEAAILGEADHVVGMADRIRIPRMNLTRRPVPEVLVGPPGGGLDLPEIHNFPGRSRGVVKVQDGCDMACSYCRTRIARGRSRSLPPEAVLRQVAAFAASGFPEVVLSGVNLGSWGRDLSPPQSLADLLRELGDLPGDFRIRLSSLEPSEVTDDLLDALETTGRVCDHFHIPLQSADPVVLRSMNRTCGPERYRRAIGELLSLFPDAAVGADVMVGFPGEEDDAFGRTVDFIESLPLAYLHVFPFSPRPGTAAELLPGRVPARHATRRARHLRTISDAKRRAFTERFIGRTLRVITDIYGYDGTGAARGVSSNYLPVLFTPPSGLPLPRSLSVLITATDGYRAIGRPV